MSKDTTQTANTTSLPTQDTNTHTPYTDYYTTHAYHHGSTQITQHPLQREMAPSHTRIPPVLPSIDCETEEKNHIPNATIFYFVSSISRLIHYQPNRHLLFYLNNHTHSLIPSSLDHQPIHYTITLYTNHNNPYVIYTYLPPPIKEPTTILLNYHINKNN